jgi:hypothetical protein
VSNHSLFYERSPPQGLSEARRGKVAFLKSPIHCREFQKKDNPHEIKKELFWDMGKSRGGHAHSLLIFKKNGHPKNFSRARKFSHLFSTLVFICALEVSALWSFEKFLRTTYS